MVVMTTEEKRTLCETLTAELPKLRDLLNVTQAQFGALTGLSRVSISKIEHGSVKLSWTHLMAIMFICYNNTRTKEYILANNILPVRFLQFVQRKDENIPPDSNILVDEARIRAYQSTLAK